MTPIEYREKVAEWLAIAVEAIGKPQKEIAKKIQVTPARFNNWVRGVHLPEPYHMYLLWKEYRISADWIWLGDDSGMPARLVDDLRAASAEKMADLLEAERHIL